MAGSQYGQQWSLQCHGVCQESPPGTLMRATLEEDGEQVIRKVGLLQGRESLLVWRCWETAGEESDWETL